MMKRFFLRVLPAFFLLLTPSLRAAEFVVSNTDDSGPGSLRQAILDAGDPSDTITFAAELSGAEIELTSGPIVIASPANILINGESLVTPVVLSGSSLSRLFEIAVDADLELVGLTLAYGQASDGTDGTDGAIPTAGSDGGNGGAIFNEGSVTLIRCLLEANSAGNGGQGGTKTGGDPGITGDGGRGGHGGAIYSTGPTAIVRLEETILKQNDAGNGGSAGDREDGATGTMGAAGKGGSGGAVYAAGGVIEVVLSTLENNNAGGGGTGGVSEGGGQSGQGGDGGDGGAIAFVDTGITITDSTLQGNDAGSGSAGGDDSDVDDFPGAGGHGGDGGAIWGFHFPASVPASVTPRVNGSYISLNQAGDGARGGDMPGLGGAEVGTDGGDGGNGGGLFLVGKPGENAVWTMENTTIYGNFTGDGGRGGDGSGGGSGGDGGGAGNGGGIAFSRDGDDYTALLSHVTIYANNSGLPGQIGSPGGSVGAGSSGGGIWEFPGGINSAPGVTLANSVVAANDADTNPNIAAGFPSEGVNFTSGNPQMGIPSNNGGPTLTIPPLRASALVNGGGTLTTPLLTDQRGAVRPFNGVPDIGAFEVALQPDLRIGASSNPATHHIDNSYSGSGAGQFHAVKLKKMKTANFYLSVQNDGEVADDLTLSGTSANRSIKLTALCLTGGPINVTAQLLLGYELADLLPDDLAVFQISVKARSKKKRAKQLLSYSARTAGVPLPDTVLAKVKQTKVKKKK